MTRKSKSMLTDQQRRVYDILIAAAEAGERCPTSMDMADRLRTSPSYIDSVITALHTKRYISVEGTVKGRIVTITETGKTTSRINAMPHRTYAKVDIIPARDIEPGRYLLDAEGRLQPMRYAKFVRAVAIVTVKAREEKSPEKPAERVEPVAAPPEPKIFIPAPERRPDPILRPMARKAKPTPVRVPVEVLSDGSDDDEYAEFQRRLAAKRAERVEAAARTATRIDGIRLAAALRQRESKPSPSPAKRPTKYAQDNGPCRFCGVRGSIGCEHFLPYERGAA